MTNQDDHITSWLTALAIIRALAEGDTDAFTELWPWQELATPGSPQDIAHSIAQIAAMDIELSARHRGTTITADLDALIAAVLDTDH